MYYEIKKADNRFNSRLIYNQDDKEGQEATGKAFESWILNSGIAQAKSNRKLWRRILSHNPDSTVDVRKVRILRDEMWNPDTGL